MNIYMCLVRIVVNGAVLASRADYTCSVFSAASSQGDEVATRHQKHQLERFAKDQPNDVQHNSSQYSGLREVLHNLPSLLVASIREIPIHGVPNAMRKTGTRIGFTTSLQIVS